MRCKKAEQLIHHRAEGFPSQPGRTANKSGSSLIRVFGLIAG